MQRGQPLLPTPDGAVFNDGQSVEAWRERKTRELAKGYNGNGGGTPLAMAVRLLPTPMTEPTAGNGHARTLGSELRLLPTPIAHDGEHGPGQGPNAQGSPSLGDAVTLLPTPMGRDGDGRGMPSPTAAAARRDAGRRMIEDAVALLPTPTASDSHGHTNRGNDRSDELLLAGIVKTLPTPTERDSRSSRNRTSTRGGTGRHHDGVTLTDAASLLDGASTGPPSSDGNVCRVDSHQLPLWTDDSTPTCPSG